MIHSVRLAACLAGLLGFTTHALHAQHTPAAYSGAAEARTALAYNQAQSLGPLALHAFLVRMPKGADLHVHLSGAIYAETWLREAAEDGMCVDPAALAFAKHAGADCGPGELKAAAALEDEHLYDRLIDAFSMRTFVPVTGESGHDHFFATFDHFSGVSKARHLGEWLDEVASRAAAQNEQYLELMETPDFKAAAALSTRLLAANPSYAGDYSLYRDALLAAGLRQQLPPMREAYTRAEQDRRAREHCETAAPAPACQVELRYIFQVLRGMPPATEFAQLLLGFELAAADPRVVGINLVRPEDGRTALGEYGLDMRILSTLHALYPAVHITLHAGEVAPGLVPPSELGSHIRDAVEQGHAERIGHGVDVMYEDRPYELLAEMAARHIMVEINLTSNDVILNVKGDEHPLPFYLAAHVPVALSTDDEGVSRIDLTHEYVRAAVTYRLTYTQLKQMVRTSLEHSFLPGASLWEASAPESLTVPIFPCRGQLGSEVPGPACAAAIKASEKAQQQWQLEHRFHLFEASFR